MEKKVEKRLCKRFFIPGATLDFKRKKFIFREGFSDDHWPISDISRGGVNFLCSIIMRPKTKISVQIYIPDEDEPLILEGVVRWVGQSFGSGESHRIGIQFNTYGFEKNQNNPALLKKLRNLENNMVKKTDKK